MNWIWWMYNIQRWTKAAPVAIFNQWIEKKTFFNWQHMRNLVFQMSNVYAFYTNRSYFFSPPALFLPCLWSTLIKQLINQRYLINWTYRIAFLSLFITPPERKREREKNRVSTVHWTPVCESRAHFYVGVERKWPKQMLSWNRSLSGSENSFFFFSALLCAWI